MQAFFVTPSLLSEEVPYDADMHPGGRPAKHPRSDLGTRITQARQEAGLSQIDLAQKMGVTQQVVAAWERKAQSIRSDTLAKLAQVLGVSADELLGTRPPRSRASKPIGKARQLFEAVSKLPRRQQEKIAAVIEAFVNQHLSGKAA